MRLTDRRRPPHQCDPLTLAVVRGLLAIGLLLVGGILALAWNGRPVQDSLIIMASGVTGGLIGFLGNSGRSGPAEQNTVRTQNVEHVNVEEAAPPDEEAP